MKLSKEWQLGVLAFILNVLSFSLLSFPLLVSVESVEVNWVVIKGLYFCYLITIVTLFHFWVDKFKYLED